MTTQPASTEISSRTAAVINELKGLEGPLLPILHGLQEEFGYVPGESLPVIADALNLSRAEVHGVVTFYHDYRNHPAGRHVLKLCRAEACQSMGGDAIAAKMQQLLGIGFHETTKDGAVTLEPVYCLGSVRLRAVGDAGRRSDRQARRREARRDRRRGAAMSVTIYIPGDSGALALGAEKVAKAVANRDRQARARRQDRPQWLARRLFPGADGRGRDRFGPRRLRTGQAQRTCRRSSTRG